MKNIAVLGITGSIGISTLEVVRQHPQDFRIVLASANRNYKELFEIADEFKIPNLVITNDVLQNTITDVPKNCDLTFGESSLLKKIENIDCDIILNAISGSAGLRFSIATITKGADLALANKESLVMAGKQIMKMLENSQSKLLPVDSEHSAILQAIGHSKTDEINSITITASGGPFRELPLDQFKNITLEDTLNHPTWDMGAKITVDSATMMNKGLEVIEAHWLFNRSYEDINAVIHPQSIIHSFVEMVDGSIIAQLSFPTMQIPILYALSYPKHIKSDLQKTNIIDLPNLTFNELSKQRYPLFELAVNAGKSGGILPTILNSANEAAIALFLQKKINFIDIYKLVEKQIENSDNTPDPSIDEIIKLNKDIYSRTLKTYKDLI